MERVKRRKGEGREGKDGRKRGGEREGEGEGREKGRGIKGKRSGDGERGRGKDK